jgi:hypothetical protein
VCESLNVSLHSAHLGWQTKAVLSPVNSQHGLELYTGSCCSFTNIIPCLLECFVKLGRLISRNPCSVPSWGLAFRGWPSRANTWGTPTPFEVDLPWLIRGTHQHFQPPPTRKNTAQFFWDLAGVVGGGWKCWCAPHITLEKCANWEITTREACLFGRPWMGRPASSQSSWCLPPPH